MMLQWFSWLARRLVPPDIPPPPRALPEPAPLKRVFPPLSAEDYHLGAERDNKPYTEDDITIALAALRGGMARNSARAIATRPARFRIAMQHAQGFAERCLLVQADGYVRRHEMYAGYVLWIGEERRDAVSATDFDFAMADHLAQIGGIRDANGYRGCRFRPDFVHRLEALHLQETRRRLGAQLQEFREKHSSGE